MLHQNNCIIGAMEAFFFDEFIDNAQFTEPPIDPDLAVRATADASDLPSKWHFPRPATRARWGRGRGSSR